MKRWWMRFHCRFLEEAAAVRGDFATAHYWLMEGERYRR